MLQAFNAYPAAYGQRGSVPGLFQWGKITFSILEVLEKLFRLRLVRQFSLTIIFQKLYAHPHKKAFHHAVYNTQHLPQCLSTAITSTSSLHARDKATITAARIFRAFSLVSGEIAFYQCQEQDP